MLRPGRPPLCTARPPALQPTLTTQMKSVGEVMAIGRTFQESFQKAMRGLETGLDGWSLPRGWKRLSHEKLIYNMRVPNPERMLAIKQVRPGGRAVAGVSVPPPWLGGWGPLPSARPPTLGVAREWKGCCGVGRSKSFMALH